MTVVALSDQHARELKRIFSQKKKEFEHPALIFDHAHLIALSAAETALALLEERALRDRESDWHLSYPYATAVVRQRKKGLLLFSYRIGDARSSREKLKVALAVNEFMAAEHKINPSSAKSRATSRGA